MTLFESFTYTYDSDNQLIKITFPDLSFVTYRYDSLGRRIEKNVSGVTTRYVYDGEDILMEYGSTGSPQVNVLQAYYTHGPGIDEPLSVARDLNHNGTFEFTEHFFYLTDALGSITAITDSTGNLVESYQYDSFGNPTIYDSTNTVIPESLINNSYFFTAREYDSESGLYYFRSRYYDPKVGRFLNEDPLPGYIDAPQSLHRYGYTLNNPVNFVDPFGLWSIDNDTVKVGLSAAEAAVSLMTVLSSPLGPIVAVVDSLSFVNSVEGGGYDPGLVTANVLIGALNVLFGNPVLGVVGTAAVAFNVGDIISKSRVPGTINSTFGDIYADFFTNPNAIQLKGSFGDVVSAFCSAGFIGFGAF